MGWRLTRLSAARGVAALVALSVVAWVGCASPRERYTVLSTFFDGVPDPDAKAVVAKVEEERAGARGERREILSRHKPFVDNQCDACHRGAAGMIQDFEAAYGACATKCHKRVAAAYPRVHGPVAAGQCQWCHAAHESAEVALLKDPPVTVCTQCHDQQLLGNTPAQHNDGKTSCLSCHTGHGGAANFLRPEWEAEWQTLEKARNGRPAVAPAAVPPPVPVPAPAPETGPAPSTRPDAPVPEGPGWDRSTGRAGGAGRSEAREGGAA